METHANTTFYNRISAYYDDLAHSSEQESTENGWKLLAVQNGERVLDIGFGTGHSLVEFAGKVGPEGTVVGIDVSTGMRDVAAERLAKAGLSDRVTLDVGVVPPLSYEDGSFDAVFLSFTLELFPLDQISEVLGEIRRVLARGGRLGVVCMEAPTEKDRETFAEEAYVWMHRHFPHIVDCQPIAVSELLEGAGFTIQSKSDTDIWKLEVAMLVATIAGE